MARGFAAFKRNTGKTHPLDNGSLSAKKREPLAKRATGKVALQDDDIVLWQGSVSVGTPLKTFTGQ